jgi:hypothetical protein
MYVKLKILLTISKILDVKRIFVLVRLSKNLVIMKNREYILLQK